MLLTIITVTYNCVSTISETLRTIISEKKKLPFDIEYIVMDGQSTDGTCEVVKRYSKFIDIYISERDSGIYNAMNKAVSVAKGDWVLFLNDGDTLFGISELLSSLEATHSDVDLVAFCVRLSSGDVFHPVFTWKIKLHNTLHHQGLCYRRNQFLKYDESYSVFSDFDLNQRYFKAMKRLEIIDKTFTSHSMGGVSNRKGVSKEIFTIVKKNFGSPFFLMSYLYFRLEGIKCRIKKLYF